MPRLINTLPNYSATAHCHNALLKLAADHEEKVPDTAVLQLIVEADHGGKPKLLLQLAELCPQRFTKPQLARALLRATSERLEARLRSALFCKVQFASTDFDSALASTLVEDLVLDGAWSELQDLLQFCERHGQLYHGGIQRALQATPLALQPGSDSALDDDDEEEDEEGALAALLQRGRRNRAPTLTAATAEVARVDHLFAAYQARSAPFRRQPLPA